MKFFNKNLIQKYNLIIIDSLKVIASLLLLFLRFFTSITLAIFSFVKAFIRAIYDFCLLFVVFFQKRLKRFGLALASFIVSLFYFLVDLFSLFITKIISFIKKFFTLLVILLRSLFIILTLYLFLFIKKVGSYIIFAGFKFLYFIWSLVKNLIFKLYYSVCKTPAVALLVINLLKHKNSILKTKVNIVAVKIILYAKAFCKILRNFIYKVNNFAKAIIVILVDTIKLPVFAIRFINFIIKDSIYFIKNFKIISIKNFFVLIFVFLFKLFSLLFYELKIIFNKVKKMVFISYLTFSAALGEKFIKKREESLASRFTHILFTFLVIIVGILAFYKHPVAFLKYSNKWQNSFTFLSVGNIATYAYKNASILSSIKYYTKNIEIKEGDAISVILEQNNISSADIAKITNILNQVFSVVKIRIGWVLKLQFSSSLMYGGYNKLEKMNLPIDNSYSIIVSRVASSDDYKILKEERVLSRFYIRKKIVIQNSLYQDAVANDISPAIISQAIKLLSWDVDFQREVGKGNEFEVVYSCMFDQYDTRLFCKDLIFLDFISQNRNVKMFKYLGDYYLQDGASVRKSLLRTPVDGARISSGFGLRKHPVLGYSKVHKGVDFAVKKGTPIFAAGDGIVTVSAWSDSYGYNVKIKHNSSVSTRYAHMSKIDKKSKVHNRVKQGDVIGYVGSTGRSTGPHLHYEIIVLGKQVNPQTISLPANERIKGDDLGYFLNHINNINHIRIKMPYNNKMNSNEFENIVNFNNINKPQEKEEDKEQDKQ